MARRLLAFFLHPFAQVLPAANHQCSEGNGQQREPVGRPVPAVVRAKLAVLNIVAVFFNQVVERHGVRMNARQTAMQGRQHVVAGGREVSTDQHHLSA